jgi:hypothetical protein
MTGVIGPARMPGSTLRTGDEAVGASGRDASVIG